MNATYQVSFPIYCGPLQMKVWIDDPDGKVDVSEMKQSCACYLDVFIRKRRLSIREAAELIVYGRAAISAVEIVDQNGTGITVRRNR